LIKTTSICLAICVTTTMPSLAAAEPVTLRLGFIAASLHLFQSTALFVAQQEGMLDREQIKLNVVPLPGVEHMVEALDKGEVEITSTATPYLIKAVLNGSDAVAVVGGPANTFERLVSRPEIPTFADLKGKTIGLSLPIDIISIGTRQLLAKHDVRDGDFTSKALIGTPVRAKCLESGECTAVPVEQPEDFFLARKGYHLLGDSHEVIPALQFAVFAARKSWANQHSDEVTRFARAMSEAYRYMADPANRDEVIRLATSATGAAPDIVAEIYQLYYEPYRGVLPRHGEISMPGFAKVIELLGMSGALQKPLPSAERFVDLRYLQAAKLEQN
jgi:ABC-type nitrate/sulfonate/bicarbonate transport system substrate-binding protein